MHLLAVIQQSVWALEIVSKRNRDASFLEYRINAYVILKSSTRSTTWYAKSVKFFSWQLTSQMSWSCRCLEISVDIELHITKEINKDLVLAYPGDASSLMTVWRWITRFKDDIEDLEDKLQPKHHRISRSHCKLSTAIPIFLWSNLKP